MTESPFQRILDKLAAGEKVTIVYEPDNPEADAAFSKALADTYIHGTANSVQEALGLVEPD